jgi:hypothetical protein
MLVLLVSIACGLAWGASLATATLSIITVIVTLQLGYLSGAAMRLFAVKGQPQLSTQGLPVEGL